MEAPDSLTVTAKISVRFSFLKKARTKASVSREAVPLPMAMARTLCFSMRDLRVRSAPPMSFLGWKG